MVGASHKAPPARGIDAEVVNYSRYYFPGRDSEAEEGVNRLTVDLLKTQGTCHDCPIVAEKLPVGSYTLHGLPSIFYAITKHWSGVEGAVQASKAGKPARRAGKAVR
jgi:hypothetical protein